MSWLRTETLANRCIDAPAYVKQPSIHTSEQPMVLLQGLPDTLCSPAMMEAVLEQAGIEDEIVRCCASPGSISSDRQREVIMTFASHRAATKCIAHFNGRSWCQRKVIARFTTSMGVPACAPLPRDFSETVAQTSTAEDTCISRPPGLSAFDVKKANAVLPPPGLSHIPCKEVCEERMDTMSTDDSTAAGVSDTEEEREDSQSPVSN